MCCDAGILLPAGRRLVLQPENSAEFRDFCLIFNLGLQFNSAMIIFQKFSDKSTAISEPCTTLPGASMPKKCLGETGKK